MLVGNIGYLYSAALFGKKSIKKSVFSQFTPKWKKLVTRENELYDSINTKCLEENLQDECLA